MADEFDIAVVGGGITGFKAALAAAEAGKRVVHLLGMEGFGGLVLNVGALEGYADGQSGIDVASALMEPALGFGVEQRMEELVAIEKAGDTFKLTTSEGEIAANLVIAATGAKLKKLDVPGAEALYGRGVSQCAWCDAPLYSGKSVAVVGGGDAAFEEALHLAESAAKVTMLIRGPRPRARTGYIERAMAAANIDILHGLSVVGIAGANKVAVVQVRDAAGVTTDMPCDGVFVFIGLEPNSTVFGDLAKRDASGAIVTDAAMATATPGLYAAGAVRAGYSGRLVDAEQEATKAAASAIAF
ncbi:MAG: FAD-dependent oxidoreductase [Proteobacteria bacterium]|nr:FAD-dependent oxidoreductase [Pseudomonadota bacterium]